MFHMDPKRQYMSLTNIKSTLLLIWKIKHTGKSYQNVFLKVTCYYSLEEEIRVAAAFRILVAS